MDWIYIWKAHCSTSAPNSRGKLNVKLLGATVARSLPRAIAEGKVIRHMSQGSAFIAEAMNVHEQRAVRTWHRFGRAVPSSSRKRYNKQYSVPLNI